MKKILLIIIAILLFTTYRHVSGNYTMKHAKRIKYVDKNEVVRYCLADTAACYIPATKTIIMTQDATERDLIHEDCHALHQKLKWANYGLYGYGGPEDYLHGAKSTLAPKEEDFATICADIVSDWGWCNNATGLIKEKCIKMKFLILNN